MTTLAVIEEGGTVYYLYDSIVGKPLAAGDWVDTGKVFQVGHGSESRPYSLHTKTRSELRRKLNDAVSIEVVSASGITLADYDETMDCACNRI